MRLLEIGLVMIATLSAAGKVPARAATLSTRAVALRLSDLPVGFTQTTGIYRTNAQSDRLDHLAPGTLARHGRLSAYEEEFKRSGLAGLIDVDSTVTLWRSAAGAQWQLALSESGARRAYRGGRFLPMSVGRLGFRSAGYKIQETVNGYRLDAFVVLLQRSRYAVYLAGAGVAGTITADQVVSLAQVVDIRVRHDVAQH